MLETAGEDFISLNRTCTIVNSSCEEEVAIAIRDDSIYEGTTNEEFMVIASLEEGSFNGRVRLNPSFVIVSIEDSNARQGRKLLRC